MSQSPILWDLTSPKVVSGGAKTRGQREKATLITHQLRTLSALVVCKETETFVAVTFQEDHTSRWTPVSIQTDVGLTSESGKTDNKSALFISGASFTYLVAVARHIALGSPISGHFVAWSNQVPNCLTGSRDASWLSSKHCEQNQSNQNVCIMCVK